MPVHKTQTVWISCTHRTGRLAEVQGFPWSPRGGFGAFVFADGASVFTGASCRADRGVRPYGCVPLRIGAPVSATLYGAGEVEPLPYAAGVNLLLQPIIDARRNIAERIIYGASAVEQRGIDLLE